MNKLPPATVAAADQAMRDVALDLDESIANVRQYLADGHDQAEAFMSLLSNFRAALDRGRPDMAAATAAVAILRLAGADR